MKWTLQKEIPSRPVTLTVSQLTGLIKDTLEGEFSQVWVEGELSGVKYHTSGHVYFTLKDVGAQIPCAMWRDYARLLRFQLKDGLRVLVKGPVQVYAPHGKYQLIAEVVEPRGAGDLQLAFEQLKIKLQGEGLFEPGRKREIRFPARSIGIVTSADGAALQDVLRVLQERFPMTRVVLAPARVQGPGSSEEVVKGIQGLNQQGGIDVILLTRGGGSLEDLWTFNEEKVARAIAASQIPVMSAIGHEVDFTIADFVADKRAPTPSAAAALLVPHQREVLGRVAELLRQLREAHMRALRRRRLEVMGLTQRLRDPRTRLRDQKKRLEQSQLRLRQVMRAQLARRTTRHQHLEVRLLRVPPSARIAAVRERLGLLHLHLREILRLRVSRSRTQLSGLASQLQGVSPLSVLSRGYSLTTRIDDGRVVQSPDDAPGGTKLRIQLARGEIAARVEPLSPSAGNGSS